MARFIRHLSVATLLTFALPGQSTGSLSEAAVLTLIQPMDIRGQGMGYVGVALPDIAFAVDVNPALLTETEYVGAGYARGAWLPTLSTDFSYQAAHATAGRRLMWDQLAVGLGFKLFRESDNDWFWSQGIEDWALSLGAGVRPNRHINIGATIKWIHSAFTGFDLKSDVVAFDFGLYLSGLLPQTTYAGRSPDPQTGSYPWADWTRTTQSGLGVGLAVRNLGGDIVYIEGAQGDPLPRVAELGLSYRLMNTFDLGLLLVGEVQMDLVGDEHDFVYKWGTELTVLRLLDVRVGRFYNEEADESPWTWGVGIGIPRLQFNYSRIVDEDGKPLKDTQMFSVTVRW